MSVDQQSHTQTLTVCCQISFRVCFFSPPVKVTLWLTDDICHTVKRGIFRAFHSYMIGKVTKKKHSNQLLDWEDSLLCVHITENVCEC